MFWLTRLDSGGDDEAQIKTYERSVIFAAYAFLKKKKKRTRRNLIKLELGVGIPQRRSQSGLGETTLMIALRWLLFLPVELNRLFESDAKQIHQREHKEWCQGKVVQSVQEWRKVKFQVSDERLTLRRSSNLCHLDNISFF